MGMRRGLLVLAVLLVLVLSASAPFSIGSSPSDDRASRADPTPPVSHRPFKMGVGPHPKNLPNATWDDVMDGYRLAGRWGELTNYWPGVPWYEEEDKLVGNASTRATVQTLYTDNGMTPVFQTNFWNLLTRPGYGFGAWLDVPPDIDPNATMADSEFRARWVDHVRSVAGEWQMEYYCIGNEVNSYHSWHTGNAADFEANLPSLMAESYAAIKEASPDTKVVITFRLVELLHYDNLDLLEMFNGTTCDIIAFTSYPSLTGDYDTPADLPEDYYHRICDHTGTMPLAIAELGWTSHDAYGGDEAEQAEFLTWFLEHTADIPWEYVQWLELHDLRAEGLANAHSQTVGLLRSDGTPKPAWEVWKETFNLSYSGDWELVPRGPILIEGDGDFDLAHGVSSGTGDAADPFVIEGWSINGTEAGYCLMVLNTTARFVVRDCLLYGTRGDGGTIGIMLGNESLGEFKGNTLRSLAQAFHLNPDSSGNLFHGNNFFKIDDYGFDYGEGNLFNLPGGPGNFWGDAVHRLFGVATHDGSEWSEGYVIGGSSGAEDEHPAVNMFGHELIPLEDQTQDRATTGDAFRWLLFSPVTDEMRSVRVWYLLDGRGTFIVMEAMDASWGSLWGADLEVPSDATGQLSYMFTAEEMDGNLTVSNISSLEVVDDDPPWLVDDLTPSEVSFGQDLTFEVEVSDNIGVAGVWIEHWYDDEGPFNLTMEESVTDRWVLTIPVAAGLGDLHYRFHVEDTSGNPNSSQVTTLSLDDTTPPVFGNDTTMSEGTTGEVVVFRVVVTDDMAIHNVTVEYGAYDGSYYDVAEMESDGDVYSYKLVVPSYMFGTMGYRFLAIDTSGNNASTEVGGIIIVDNDPPTATVVSTLPPTVGTGESHQVVVNVDDNVAVWSVTFHMELDTGEGDPLFLPLNLLDMGGSFQGTVHLSTEHVGTITHHLTVIDLYGNAVNTTPATSRLVDTIPPEMEYLVSVTTKVDKEVFLEVEATDNLGIVEVTWKGLPFEPDGMFANGTFDEPGEHKVTVTVRDAAGNEATDEFFVYVEDDSDLTTVMLQVVLVVALLVAGLLLTRWMLARRAEEGRGDPELEDAPEDELVE